MTVHNTTGAPEQKKGAFSQCVNDAFLQAVRPTAEKFTEFRPIPEVGPEGNPLPMVRMMTPNGPDLTNMPIESIIVNSGLQTRFSGLSRASDVPSERDYDKVFPRIFIALRSAQKKNIIPPHLAATVELLFKEDAQERTAINRPTDFALMQGIAITVNDQKLEKAKSHQCFFLSATAKSAVAKLCEDSYKEGIDLFHPTTGYTIILKGRPPNPAEGRTVWSTIAERGRVLPVNPTKFWVPWSHGLKLYTFAEQLKLAVRCYGADIVKWCWPGEYAEIIQGVGAAPAVVHQRPPAAAAPTPDTSMNLDDVDGIGSPPIVDNSGDEDIISSATHAAPAAPAATAAPRPPAAPAAAVSAPKPAVTKDPGAPPSPEALASAFEGLL